MDLIIFDKLLILLEKGGFFGGILAILIFLFWAIKKYPNVFKKLFEAVFKRQKFRHDFLLELSNLKTEITKRIDKLETKVDNNAPNANLSSNKNKITNRLYNIVQEFIDNHQIKNDELKKLLLNCAKFGSNVFKEALDIGLDNININMFRTMTAVSFSEIRGFISTTKLEVSQDFKKEIKNEIIYPEVEIFIEIFKFDQRQFENGELIDKLIFNSEILVKNIITQILNNFNAK